MTAPPPQADWRTQRRLLRAQGRLERARLRALRRHSVVGPVLLLGSGVVFLLIETGKLSRTAVVIAFSRYWPLLLVGAGLIWLGEWYLDRRDRDRALAIGSTVSPRTVGFATSFTIVLVVVLGLGFTLVPRTQLPFGFGDLTLDAGALPQLLGEKHETEHSYEHACPPGTTLLLRNAHGDVRLEGTSSDGTARLSTHETVYATSDDEAAHRESAMVPSWTSSNGTLTLSVPSVESSRADLTLTVPSQTNLIVMSDSGDVHIHSLAGDVTVTTGHGDLELNGIEGAVTAHTKSAEASISGHAINGPISLEGRALDITLSDLKSRVRLDGDFFGTVHLERADGGLQLHTGRVDLQFAKLQGELELTQSADLTADQVTGPFLLNTRNRNISLDRVSGDITINNRNGTVSLQAVAPLGVVTVENRNGPIEVTLPARSDADVLVETTNGKIDTNLPLPVTEEAGRSRVAGALGHGGKALHLATSQADIKLEESGS